MTKKSDIEKIWVLTVVEDGDGAADVYTRLFRRKESAIRRVLDGLEVDWIAGLYKSTDDCQKAKDDARRSLEEDNCWYDKVCHLDFDLDEQELEDDDDEG